MQPPPPKPVVVRRWAPPPSASDVDRVAAASSWHAGEIGLALQAWRRVNNVAGTHLARRLRVTPDVVSHMEAGRRRPVRRVVPALADLLGWTVEDVERVADLGSARAPAAPKPVRWTETAARLQAWRIERHPSRDTFAGRLGVTAARVAAWEAGYSRPQLHRLPALASALDLTEEATRALLEADVPPTRRKVALASLGRLRRARGLTQAAVARACGVDQSQYAAGETGRVPLRHLPVIARALGTDPRALYAAAVRPDPSPPKPRRRRAIRR